MLGKDCRPSDQDDVGGCQGSKFVDPADRVSVGGLGRRVKQVA